MRRCLPLFGSRFLAKNIFIFKEVNEMRLNAPRFLTFMIALILGVLGIVSWFVPIPLVSVYGFWFVAAGFVLLALAAIFKGL